MLVLGVELSFQNIDRIRTIRLVTDLYRPHGIYVVCRYEQHMKKKNKIDGRNITHCVERMSLFKGTVVGHSCPTRLGPLQINTL